MFISTRKITAIFTIVAFVLLPNSVYALPQGGTVVTGSGVAVLDDSVANELTVNQYSDKVIIEYDSFSIANGETVTFDQPFSTSIALNRVLGGSVSEIFGALNANGIVYLVNTNGVIFSPTASLDVAGLVASTLDITNSDFLSFDGQYNFFKGESAGSIVNQAQLSVPGGFIALLGSNVENQAGAVLLANKGTVALASGDATTLSLDGNDIISVVVTDAASVNPGEVAAEAGVVNAGTIQAAEGKVLVTADVLDDVFDNAINNSGIVEARNIYIWGDGTINITEGSEITASGQRQNTNNYSEVFISNYQETGDINIDGSTISATLDGRSAGSARVFIWSDDYLDIADSTITSEVKGHATSISGAGDYINDYILGYDDDYSTDYEGSFVSLWGETGLSIDPTDVTAKVTSYDYYDGDEIVGSIGGDGSAKVWIETQEDGSDISILGNAEEQSTVTASVQEDGDAEVKIEARDNANVSVGYTDITAAVGGHGDAEVDVMSDGGNISLLESSAEATLGTGNADVAISTVGGSVDIIQSGILAGTEGDGDAEIGIKNFPETGEATVLNTTISGSVVEAIVNGEGEAFIDIESGHDVVLNNTDVLALIGSGDDTAEVDIEAINNVNILNDSAVLAEVLTDGTAEIHINMNPCQEDTGCDAENIPNDIGDIFIDNSELYALVRGNGSAKVGTNPEGNITVSNGSEVKAEVLGPESVYNTATVSLYGGYDNTVVISNSLLKALVTDNGKAEVKVQSGDDSGNVTIIDSTLTAEAGSGEAQVFVRSLTGDVMIDPSTLGATVMGEGDAKVYIESPEGNIDISGDAQEDVPTLVYARTGEGDAKVEVTTERGNVTVTNSEIESTAGEDSAKIKIFAGLGKEDEGGTVTLDDSELTAEVLGSGDAEIEIMAGHYSSNNLPGAQSSDWNVDETEELDGPGKVNILNDSVIEASIAGDNEDTVSASVEVKAKDIDIQDSFIFATVLGRGQSLVDIWAGNYAYEHAWWDFQNMEFVGGDLNIERSGILASVADGWNSESWNTRADINVQGKNINMDGSAVIAQQKEDGNALVDIIAGDFNDNEEYQYRDFNGGQLTITNPVTTFVDDDERLIIPVIPSVAALVGDDGYAHVNIEGGGIDVDKERETISYSNVLIDNSASVLAQVNSNGDSYITISAGDYYNNSSDHFSNFYGSGLNVFNGSSIEAIAGNMNREKAEAWIEMYGGTININDSSIFSQAIGRYDSDTGVDLYAADYFYENDYDCDECRSEDTIIGGEINVENGSDILADALTQEEGYSEVYFETGGDVNVSNSTVQALTHNDYYGYYDGEAWVEFNLIDDREEEVEVRRPVFDREESHNLTIADSTINAIVDGEGHAEIAAYDKHGQLQMLGLDVSELLSDAFDMGHVGGPINGTIDISNSTLYTEANSISRKPSTSVIGMMSVDDITISNSSLDAVEDEGVSLIGLLSENNISVVNSSLSTKNNGNLAATGLLAYNDISITGTGGLSASSNWAALSLAVAGGQIMAPASVSAVASDGVAIGALLAIGDVYAGNVSAQGGADVDVLQWVEALAEDFSGSSLDILAQYPYASAVLLGSLSGDVTVGNITADLVLAAALGLDVSYEDSEEFDIRNFEVDFSEGTSSILNGPGDVSANFLYMLAKNNIGQGDNPIATDVGIVAGYSYGSGDIFINQVTNKTLEVGMYLPITATRQDQQEPPRAIIQAADGEGPSPRIEESDTMEAFLGASLAAKDGIVSVTSDADIIINSIIAANGGAFIQSSEGSVYAGQGWDPYIDGEFPSELAQFLMPMPWGEGEGYGYFSPIMVGSANHEDPLYDNLNLIASGYSYISTPVGTIGVGTQAAKDEDNSGQVAGYVNPLVTTVNDDQGVSLDLRFGVPPGYVVFQGEEEASSRVQVWPEIVAGDAGAQSFDNPLMVYVHVVEGAHSALPEGYPVPGDTAAGLTLQIGNQLVSPAGTQVPYVANEYLRAYYELLDRYRVTTMQPIVPTEYYAYHPVGATDSSAFDQIQLDAGAYEFIDGNLNTNNPLAPYFGEEEEEEDNK